MKQEELFPPPPTVRSPGAPLIVCTAQFKYRGPDRFDVTRKSGGPTGHPFAPSWRILGPGLDARRRAKQVIADAEGTIEVATKIRPELVADGRRNARDHAESIERAAWCDYVPAFFEEMKASQERWPEAWRALLARERVVLVCYCAARDRCHRGLLVDLLVQLGAVDGGELAA